MTTSGLAQQLERLALCKRDFGPAAGDRLVRLLGQLGRRRFRDPASLAVYHETLLFLRAYPVNHQVVRATEKALAGIPEKVGRLADAGIDLSPLNEADLSGIVGTSVSGVFSYPVAAWLADKHSRAIEIDWPGYEDEARLAQTLPRFLPLLEDETLVEAHFPYLEWIEAAAGPAEKAAPWLIARFNELEAGYAARAELYDSLRLYLTWTPTRYRSSRTGMRFPARKPFYHREPLIARREVSLVKELDGPPLESERLSAARGAAILELIRQTSTQRYRELHGFSYGDADSFLRFDAGRGIDIYLNEVTSDHRLPLRAYHSGFMVKNGVPIGYVEGLSLFDRMEIGFNLYYTFRDGESAYLYARVMKVFHQHLGINCFSVDPYQIGHENEEGLASGAFWFYRKLGFQPARPELLALVQREEQKITARADYRSSLATLKRIAEGHVFYDHAARDGRDWSSFQVRNLGLAVQRKMRKIFGGHSDEFRAAAQAQAAKALGVNPKRWPALDQQAFGNWALVLFLIDGLGNWTIAERKLVVQLIHAKGTGSEAEYLALMQRHHRLRKAVNTIGQGAEARTK